MKDNTPDWVKDAQFYHIYPLGFCGAPLNRREESGNPSCLESIAAHGEAMVNLGINALYLGPVFESSVHGYDTIDFFQIDRRLGTNEDMARTVWLLKERGIRVILDGVFHHVGREHFAFQDLLVHREASEYRDWFSGVNFGGDSPWGDGFAYDGWNGCYDLVKLNLSSPAVREHLFGAAAFWMDQWGIDGLRLDAADSLDADFMDALSDFCLSRRDDFWLMGEVIHGDYNHWMAPGRLHSVTNYECYKGLWSSFNDGNMHEIAWSLNRQFGDGGVYAGRQLYNFADNHDVNRIGSTLKDRRHLYPLHILLYTMPGVPSLYYGSEYGLPGVKDEGRGYANDAPLRPSWPHVEEALSRGEGEAALCDVIPRLAALRREQEPLKQGRYRQVAVTPRQLAFEREYQGQLILIVVNGDTDPSCLGVDLPAGTWEDLLNPGFRLSSGGGHTSLPLDAAWGRVLVRK